MHPSLLGSELSRYSLPSPVKDTRGLLPLDLQNIARYAMRPSLVVAKRRRIVARWSTIASKRYTGRASFVSA